ncbi:EAL domain-containing protein [Bacillus sp. BHET2]|uniref:putative bifunctional diguanylate cyclase/phosphodiesterase n=1 Tax=Bacillus sp. BHET2 TaxID=2583818 RepID=UPI00110E9EA4|nr:EAL domain-containing protein [Bacillus sp. BHET2]TMU84264.1 EAL domain-containing protein [Bacillus sp. BHET2]
MAIYLMVSINLLMSITLSAACSYLALRQAIKKIGNSLSKIELLLSSFTYTVFYCLLHASVTLMVSYDIFVQRFMYFAPVFFVIGFVSISLSLQLFQNVNTDKINFLRGGFIFSLIMTVGNFATYVGLIYPFVTFKPMYISLTILMTLGVTFPFFRMLLQLNNQEIASYKRKQHIFWSIVMGFGFSGVTYLSAYSLLSPVKYGASLSLVENNHLIPFIIEMAILLILWFIPDQLANDLHKKQMKKIYKKEQEYKSLYENNLSAIFTYNRDAIIVEANERAAEMTGYPVDKIIGKGFLTYVMEKDLEQMQSAFHQSLRGNAMKFEMEFPHRNGHIMSIQVIVVPIYLEGEVTGAHVLASDITDAVKDKEKIQYLAYHDELTGLPNRRYFNEAFEKKVEDKHEQMAILLLDLNRFKIVNDTLGHGYGDELISQVGKRCVNVLGEKGLIARMSGDEFIVLLPSIKGRSDIHKMATAIHTCLETPFDIGGHDIMTSTSIGISLYPHDGHDLSTLLKKADIAMYTMKKSEGAYQLLFSDQLEEKGINPIELEENLRNALINDEFELYYQPQLSLTTNEIVGVEALIRWNHPIKGLIPPADFIPLAEETGLIIPLGRHILNDACKQLKSWLINGYEFKVSINVSSRQFHDAMFVDVVREVLDTHMIPPSLIELEITESTAMHHVEEALTKMNALREIGVSIAIDDFGIEYSSLSYLQKFSIQTLKIDRSFIMGLDENESNKAIVAAIHAMAKHLQLVIVAEGVETESQLNWLRDLQCEYAQGYYFSKPFPPDTLIDYINQRITAEVTE